MPASILVIEDDDAIVTLLTYNLKSSGHEVTSAGTAEEGELLLKERHFDLLILDWMLPDKSGIELCQRLRRSVKLGSLPILMLTARGEEADRVRGLGTGADDYVVKPFSLPELLARVAALLRRSSPERVAERLQCGDIVVDRGAHKVTRGNRVISIGPTEFRLLETLLESQGRVLSRNQLIDRVWGSASKVDERTVDVHIGRLRKAIVRGNEPDPVRTVRGAGYIIEKPEPE
jgi:two-component system phosphate regulon response regulator PhoB